VELLSGVEGLCHRSEIASEPAGRGSARHTASEEPALPVGQEFEFKIIKMNEAQKRIGLSQRAITDDDERNRLQQYKQQAAAATSTVGHAIKQHKREDRNQERE
jgi:small subunit ribosomal protein S1